MSASLPASDRPTTPTTRGAPPSPTRDQPGTNRKKPDPAATLHTGPGPGLSCLNPARVLAALSRSARPLTVKKPTRTTREGRLPSGGRPIGALLDAASASAILALVEAELSGSRPRQGGRRSSSSHLLGAARSGFVEGLASPPRSSSHALAVDQNRRRNLAATPSTRAESRASLDVPIIIYVADHD